MQEQKLWRCGRREEGGFSTCGEQAAIEGVADDKLALACASECRVACRPGTERTQEVCHSVMSLAVRSANAMIGTLKRKGEPWQRERQHLVGLLSAREPLQWTTIYCFIRQTDPRNKSATPNTEDGPVATSLPAREILPVPYLPPDRARYRYRRKCL